MSVESIQVESIVTTAILGMANRVFDGENVHVECMTKVPTRIGEESERIHHGVDQSTDESSFRIQEREKDVSSQHEGDDETGISEVHVTVGDVHHD